jgi:hypothetical protein
MSTDLDINTTKAPPNPPPPPPAAPSRAADSQATAGLVKLNLEHPRPIPAADLQPQPASGARPAAELVTGNARFKALPSEVRSAILAYLALDPDKPDKIDTVLRKLAEVPPLKLALFAEIHNAEEMYPENPQAFATWLQRQREDLKGFYAAFYQPVLGAPWIDLHPLTPEQRIDGWLEKHHRPSDIHDALEGGTELLKLPPAQQRYLMSRAFEYMMVSGFHDLAGRVQKDENVRGVVAEALIDRAVELERNRGSGGSLVANDPHNYASALASDALIAMGRDDAGLGELLHRMKPENGALFAQALGDGGRQDAGLRMSPARHQVLSALNGAPRTPTTHTIVENLYMQIEPRDLTMAPGLAHAMAVAVAREWYPDDKVKAGLEAARLEALMQGRYAELLFGGNATRKAIVFNALRSEGRITADLLAHDGGGPARNRTVTNAMAHVMIATQRLMPFGAYEEDAAWRLGGILAIDAGTQLFFSDKVPAAARAQALAIIIAQEINSRSFKTGDNAWLAPALAGPIAALYTQGYGNALGTQPLPGLSLDNMVGFAMGIAPTLPKGQAWRDLWKGVDGQAVEAKIAAGKPVTAKELGAAYDLLTGISFYSGQENVAAIVEQIQRCANTDPPRVKLLPVIVFGENGPIKCPLFRVQSGPEKDGVGTFAYVDNAGRKYDSIEEWEETNRLPPGRVYYPGNDPLNRLIGDGKGGLVLVSRDTPRTHQEIREALDTAAMAGCFAAGVVGLVVTDGALALVAGGVGAASGLWFGGRSVVDWIDRYTHGQSVSPLDMEALGIYFGAIGGLAGGVAFVGTAARGTRLGGTAASIIGGAHDVAAVAGIAGLAHQVAMLGKNLKDMSPEEQMKEVLKLIAFGGITLAGAAKPQPTVATPRPPVTPTTPPSGLPTARVGPPGRPIPIGSAPPVTTNKAIGLQPEKAQVSHTRPAQPSSPGRPGYDPVASGKTPANGNASPGNGYDPAASGPPCQPKRIT